MQQILVIAKQTFKEAVRNKILFILIAFGVITICCSVFMPVVGDGREKIKIVESMCFRSIACNLLQQFEAVADWARRAVHEPRAAGGGYWSYAVLASALANLGQIEEAREAVDEALQRKPDLSLAYLKTTLPTKQPGGLEIYFDGLRKAGLPD